jgi:hypothetical protein
MSLNYHIILENKKMLREGMNEGRKERRKGKTEERKTNKRKICHAGQI